MPPTRRATKRTGFTLLELLVVMGIIVLLAAILVPIVSQVRMRAYVAATEGQMRRILAACEQYYHDFKAYPGPIANSQLNNASNGITIANTVSMLPDPNVTPAPPVATMTAKITSSENLVLGLLGILSAPGAAGAPPYYTGFNPAPKHDVVNLNYNRPASYHYIDFIPEELSLPSGYAYTARTGIIGPTPTKLNVDALAQLPLKSGDPPDKNAQPLNLDTFIPEFVDRIPDFMPILYIRANVGIPTTGSPTYSGIASTNQTTNPAQYDVTQLSFYGFNHVSADPATTNNDFPVATPPPPTDPQWVAYFLNPAIAGQPRGKDSFILISAGPDRLYGTKDDIIVTP